jgi:hypothetical protein
VLGHYLGRAEELLVALLRQAQARSMPLLACRTDGLELVAQAGKLQLLNP